MDSINPNTPVVEQSKAEVNAGDTGVYDTFADLEAASASKAKSKQAKESEELQNKGKELNVPAKETKSEKTEKSEPKGKEVKETKAEKKEAEEVRRIKARLKDKELELEEDVEIPFSVNGKDEYLPLKEIRSQFSGKVAWDRKFQQLDQDRKGFLKEKDGFVKEKDQFNDLLNEKDPKIRLFKMAQMNGKSPTEIRKQIFEENIKALEKWSTMSDDEKRNDELAFENEWLKYQTDKQTHETKSKAAMQELAQKVHGLSEKFKFSNDDFVGYYDYLKGLQNEGRLPKDQQITPEFVSENLVKERIYNKAAEQVKALKLDWDNEMAHQKIVAFTNDVFHHGFEDQIPEIISEIWGSGKKQKVVEAKKQEAAAFKSGEKSPSNKPQVNPELFDELF
jgi:hypothetical protein